ncbi:hypothetical protein PQR71_39920 [Paraburkholderia fungorum]|uniref:glycine-rich domain-containing protein n=1 Tax=Paraburkholderia fungorum TaxID=134537 RepID=UPI0038BA27BE
MLNRLFAAFALLWLCTSVWAGGSTVNPAVPVFGAAMSSAPIRNNFAAAYSDINGLIGQNNSAAAPASPVLGQLWLNTSAAPYVLNEWDGSAWVQQGALNPATHLWSFAPNSTISWASISGTPTTLAGYGITNGVSSVGLTLPSIFTCGGSPITSSGTFSCVLNNQSPSLFLASPNGSTGAPTFRAIQSSDVPTLNQNTTGNAATATTATLATSALSAATATTAGNVTGVVAVANGGTASTTAAAAFNMLSPMTTTGDVEYESAAGTASRLPIGSNGQVFTVVSGAPAWASPASVSGGTLKRSTHTAVYTAIASDQASVLYSTGTWALTLTTPATLGNGWWAIAQNAGTGNITLSPASGQIDGLSSYVMYPGETRIINTDGTNFYSVVLNPLSLRLLTTTTITIPPGYSGFKGILWGGGGGGFSGTGGANIGGGGGGGAAVPFEIASLGTPGATITCTVAGTAAAGINGNSSTLGSLFTAFGGAAGAANLGGGGGGALSAGSSSAGGTPGIGSPSVGAPGLGGANAGISSAWGGAGGGNTSAGANSVYGGAGGGSPLNATTNESGGTSYFGGAGGASALSGTASAGMQPGGGGGGNYSGTGGAGGAGECYINGVI